MTNEELGLRIRNVRELKGITQAGLAASLNIDQRTVSRIEKGDLSPKFETLVRICESLDITLNHLLNFNVSYIFNNYSTNQTGGELKNFNNTPVEQIEKLYSELLAEKERMILLLMQKEQS